MEPDDIRRLILKSIPDTQVQIEDLTGTGDHFGITVISKVFRGKPLVEQHRIVQRALQPALDDGSIHAVQIKTKMPDQPAEQKSDDRDFHILS